MNNFTNVATFDVYQILTKGIWRDVANRAKQIASDDTWNDELMRAFLATEITKYYNAERFLDVCRVDFNEINIPELRSVLK